MASNIKFKRSAVQNRVPTTAQLDLGELALNTYDGKLYTEINTGSASVVEIGSKLSSLVVDGDNGAGGGDVTFHGTTANRDLVWDHSADRLILKDNTRIQLGDAATDLEMYHSGGAAAITNNTGNFYLTNTAANFFYIRTNNLQITRTDQTKTHASFTSSAVVLNHDNSARVTTTADGADIGGTGSLKIPVGTTAQRSSSPVAGDLRYNTTTSSFEGYSTDWGDIGAGGIGIGSDATNPRTGIIQNRVGVGFTDLNIVGAGISVTGYGTTVFVDFNEFKPGSFHRTIHNYTATAGQTTFAGLNYENGEKQIAVYLNGARLSEATYTATSGTTVVLDVGASVGDEVEIINIHTNSDVDRKVNTYTATAGQTTFTGLSYNSKTELDVYLNGIRLASDDFTATSGTTVVLAVGASVNDTVDIVSTGDGVTWRSTTDASGDRFTLTNVGIGTDQTPDRLNVRGNSSFVGLTTFTGNTIVDGVLAVKSGNESTDRLQIGDSGQLRIYHAGHNYYRSHSSTANHIFTVNGAQTVMSLGSNGTVNLFYQGSNKLQTTNTGINVNGNLAVSGVLTYDDVTNVDSVGIITARSGIVAQDDVTFQTANSNNLLFDKSDNSLKFGDNVKAKFGDNSGTGDLEIYHTGSGSVINDVGQGSLHLRVGGSNRINVEANGVRLFYQGNEKLETTSTGVTVTGKLTATDEIISQDDIRIQSTYPRLYLTDTDSNDDFSLINNNGSFLIYNDTQAAFRLKIDGTTGQCAMTLRPTVDSTFDIGTNTLRWANVYADTLHATTLGSTLSYTSDTPRLQFTNSSFGTSLYIGGYTGNTNTSNISRIRTSTGNLHIDSASNGNLYLNHYSSGDVYASNGVVWTTANDGSGSGLDADTLDGQHGSYYAVDSTAVKEILTDDDITSRMDSGFYETSSATTAEGWPETTNAHMHLIASTHSNTSNYHSLQIASPFSGQTKFYIRATGNSGTQSWSKIWTSSSDGSGSGLDADTVDGIEGANFLRSNADDSTSGSITFSNDGDGIFVYGGGRFYKRNGSGVTIRLHNANTPLKIENNSGTFLGDVFHSGNDGSGSGLDADTLDGVQGSQFLRSDAADTASGDITFSGGAGAVTIAAASDIRLASGTWTGNAYGKIQHHSDRLYIAGGSAAEYMIVLRGNSSTDRVYVRENGTIYPAGDSTSDLGKSANRWANVYADSLNATSTSTVNDILLRTNAHLTRSNHHSGHLEGSYNNIGDNSQKSNPIYTIGSSYNPNDADLGTQMYGIGFTHRNASFINSYVPSGQAWGLYIAADADARIFLSGTGGSIWPTGVYGRLSHHTGHLQGSYNNIGANSAKSNPIYTIGSSYNPNEENLSNMYGVGFTHNNASFIGSNLSSGSTGWGFYVAADGDARVYLNGSYGTIQSTGQHYVSNNVVWNAGNDGSGSGLDADTVDGIQGASFLRSDAADTASGDISFAGGAGAVTINQNSDIRFGSAGSWTGEAVKLQHHASRLYIQGGTSGIMLRGSDGGDIANFANTLTTFYDPVNASGDVTFNGGAGAVTVGANSDIRLANGNWTGNSTKIQHHNNSLYIQGGSGANNSKAIIFRDDGGTDRWIIDSSGHFIPSGTDTYDIGSSSARVRNIYTQDLQLSNEAKKDTGGNDVDGTWGNWTLQEGEEEIFMINNRTGKKYAMMLREVA